MRVDFYFFFFLMYCPFKSKVHRYPITSAAGLQFT